MAKGPTKQHYVPQCYLREWIDPKTPTGQEPYVWIFNRGEKKGRKKAPSNIFTETDIYTLKMETGEKVFTIEEALSELEGRYAALFKSKISKQLPLNEEDRVVLCAFVAAMLQRTPRFRDNMLSFHNEIIEMTESMERANGLDPKESQHLKEMRDNSHKMTVVQLLPHLTTMLMDMSIAFLCSDGSAKYVTSDDPCMLFNPQLQWQRFYGPGLGQEKIEVFLPLSPDISLCMSRSPLKGYIRRSRAEVEESNRMAVNHCYKYFVANSPRVRRHWFRRYPLDFFFILRIIGHKVLMTRRKIERWYKYGRHVRRK